MISTRVSCSVRRSGRMRLLPNYQTCKGCGCIFNKIITFLNMGKKRKSKQYTFILGARIKNEAYAVVSQIEKLNLKNGETTEISKGERLRLIISFPDKRATKDKFNREMGLKRLEKKINAGIQEKGDDTASFSTFKPTQVVYGVFSAEQIQH